MERLEDGLGVFRGIRNVLLLYALIAAAWWLLACAEPVTPEPVTDLPAPCEWPYYRMTLHGCKPVPMWELAE